MRRKKTATLDLPLLSDPKDSVRASAAAALQQLGWARSSSEAQPASESATGDGEGAARAEHPGLKALVTDLKHDTSFKRRAAAEALQEISDPRALKPLLRAVGDKDPTVRVSAIHALSRQPEKAVTPTLLKLLSDKDPCVRLAAAQVLSHRDEATLAKDFVNLLLDTNFEVRITAVQFLGKIHDDRVAETLLPMLKDADNDVRQHAAKALGNVGSPKAIEALVMALIDEERAVRQAAEGALAQIDRHWIQTEAAQNASRRLEASMENCPAWVRASATQVLTKLREAAPGTSAQPDLFNT